VTGGAGAPLDNCGGTTSGTYCNSFYHYLVFTVTGTTVTVQVIALPESLKKTHTKKNGGKND